MLLAVEKIKKWQKRYKMNQGQMADFIGISRQYMSMINSGNRTNISDNVKKDVEDKTKGYIKFADWGKNAPIRN